jgi:uncharacterized repeat protein (TIGR03803 family)
VLFEIAKTAGGYAPVTTLATFDGANGDQPYGPLTIDAAGDLFGTTSLGGDAGDGLVFEIAKTAGGYGPLTTLLAFTGTNGANPVGGLTTDAAGDLFGTTVDGGASGEGTVFEILNSGFVVAPTITGTVAGQETGAQASDKPFSAVTITDAIAGSTVTVAIQLTGAGSLADGSGFSGLSAAGTPGRYTLTGTAIADTQEIDALVFTPAASATHAAATTTFALTATANTGASSSNTATTVLVDPGPTTGAVSSSLADGASIDLTSLILGAAKPGIAGDKLTISGVNASGSLGAVSLVGGDLVYSATTAALANIPANGSVTDSFAYTIADAYGDTAAGTVKITVTNPVTVINGPANGDATIQGTTHSDIINAFGWYNTIYDNGGNDTVNAGQGNATVYAGAGNVVVNLQGYYDTVSGGDGADKVSGSQGNTSVTLGNGADSVSTGGYYNTITLGSGNDVVNAGSGNAIVSLGGGGDSVTIGGYNNKVTAGNGNDTVTGGSGSETVTLGNGADKVTTSGNSNLIMVGSGSNTIVAGSGLDTVVAGSGVDAITLAGQNNSVTLNGASATVTGGQGADSVVVNGGGKDTLTFAGPNSQATLNGTVTASIADNGQTFHLNVGSSTQTDTITGFGSSDVHALLELLHGAGGYGSAAAVVSALHSDSHGGTLLSLGASGSIDFLGTAPSQLHASNFQIG